MRLPSKQQMATDQNSNPTPKKPRGRPFKPGESGNPTGRPPGIETTSMTLPLTTAISAIELASKGLGPRQIARLLKARPNAVKEALSQSRRLMEVCAPKFAEHWLRASQVAAEEGDHKPAMAALQSIDVVKPVVQTYDTGPGGKAVAAVKVEIHNFGFAGLPQPQPQPQQAIDVTATESK
jgi:hypothetical protein